ncbi:glycosyltransferase family 2 protein [Patescibacteria group bacterium]|nr:glycosyltransferase family 2 protein [Patescibacteria group bacterium]
MKLSSLTAFFPCYNEEANVELMVQQLEKVLPRFARKYEILVINDGSTDRTGKIADQLSKKFPAVRAIHHPTNLGYGASLRTGFNHAKYDWTFFTDGDMQFDVSQLEEFLPYTADFNVIIGYRKHRADGGVRAFNARLFKLYIDLLFRLHVKDIDCAFKLLNTQLIQSLHLQSTGAFTSAEMLYRLKKRGEKMKQLPVDHFPRKFGTPTGNNPKVVIKAGVEAFKVYFHAKLEQLQSAG